LNIYKDTYNKEFQLKFNIGLWVKDLKDF
jgi:hypothetical protein